MSVEPCGLCSQPTRMRYPGNDPENGPARRYCKSGHSTCYECGKWFHAETEQSESYECDECEAKHDPCEFDDGYEGVDESTPPPGYCQEAWDYRTGFAEDPMSAGAPIDEFVADFDRKHYTKCETCRKRIDLSRMP